MLEPALTCMAQATAQISGTVKDQSGAVLPGVEVTATQTDTGVSRDAVTNETGSYVLPNLPIGPYRLEAALPGFRTFVQTGIVLQVNGSPSINPVSGSRPGDRAGRSVRPMPRWWKREASVSVQVVENARILELPLNGRQVDRVDRACRARRRRRPLINGAAAEILSQRQLFGRGWIEHRIELHAGRRLSQQSV